MLSFTFLIGLSLICVSLVAYSIARAISRVIGAARESEKQRLQLKQQALELSDTNDKLVQQKEFLRQSEGHLRRALDELEVRVEERTLELTNSIQELERSRKTYEDLVNTIDGIVWEAKVGISPYTFVSLRAEKILGYPIARWTTESGFWQRILHPDDLVQFTGLHYATPEKKKDRQTEYRVIAADGRIVWMKDFVTVVYENGRPAHLRGIMVDITERKNVEESLRIALDAAEMGNWDVNLETGETRRSLRHDQIFGYSTAQEEWSIQICLNHVYADDRQEAEKSFKSAFESGQLKLDCRVIWPDRSLHWIVARGKVYYDGSGKPIRIVGIVMDMTDQKLAELAALEASKLKSEFLANMSHEIRTPLNAIIGMASLVLDSKLTQPQKSDVDTIKRSADALLSLINDILDFSKIEAGKLDLEVLDFDLERLLGDSLGLVSLKAEEKSLKLSETIAADCPRGLRGDSGRLLQILTNLLSNAVKFTETGQVELMVSAHSAPDGRLMTRFEVRDTGIGMSRKTQDQIFRPFSQGDGSMARKYGGTGLGLSICKRLVELMGGQIGAESIEKKGSCFWFTVPLEIARESVAAEPEKVFPKMPLAKGESRRILVAEDNVANQKVLLRFLEKLGHRANAVANGREVVREAERKPYDLIFMDCQMPEMDGYDATREIRHREATAGGRRTPIVALTAHALSGDRSKCLEAGMDDYITKPVVFSVLEETTAKWSRPDEASLPPLIRTRKKESVWPLVTLDQGYLDGLEALQMEGMPDIVLEVMEIFQEMAPVRLGRMCELHSKGRMDELGREAHAMKSTAGSVGAQKLGAICTLIENKARDPGTSGEVAELLKSMRQEIQDVEAGLEAVAERKRVQ